MKTAVILYFVVLFAFALKYISCMSLRSQNALQWIKWLIGLGYSYANLYYTILFRVPQEKIDAAWIPFWSYREAIDLCDGFRILNTELFFEIVHNVLLFIPAGYILPYIKPGLFDEQPGKTVLFAMLCSVTTEVMQLFGRIGLFEFDDIINNTLGGMIGFGLYQMAYKRRRTREMELYERAFQR